MNVDAAKKWNGMNEQQRRRILNACDGISATFHLITPEDSTWPKKLLMLCKRPWERMTVLQRAVLQKHFDAHDLGQHRDRIFRYATAGANIVGEDFAPKWNDEDPDYPQLDFGETGVFIGFDPEKEQCQVFHTVCHRGVRMRWDGSGEPDEWEPVEHKKIYPLPQFQHAIREAVVFWLNNHLDNAFESIYEAEMDAQREKEEGY